MVSYSLRLLLRELVTETEKETRLVTCLIPALKPGQVVIADNATFHREGRIQELIEAADCRFN